MLQQGRLDLDRLDTKTSNLDLVIEPTEKLDVAVGQITKAVAGSVQACVSVATE
jgi:hypothetical protein